MYYLGVDSGQTGAACLLYPNGGIYDVADFKTIQSSRLWTVITTEPQLVRGVLELVHGGSFRPGEKSGSVSSFKYGAGFGWWQGCLTALQIEHQEVPAVTWHKIYDPLAKRHEGKKRSLDLARRTWPEQAGIYFKREKDHNRADAACIAKYCREVVYG